MNRFFVTPDDMTEDSAAIVAETVAPTQVPSDVPEFDVWSIWY